LYRQASSEPELFYWQRNEKSNLAEVDYVVQIGQKIIPIEVKAGTSGKLKSLHQFILSHDTPIAIKVDSNLPSQKEVKHSVKTLKGSKEISFKLISLPLYLTTQLDRILAQE
jgi:predicted AAA+ superfamily ATPase